MSAWSIAFRMLLVLALVLNGTASAVAGARMAVGHDHAMQTSGSTNMDRNTGNATCHDAPMDGVAVEYQAHDHAAATRGPDNPSEPDCCKGGTCQCACTGCTQLPISVTPVEQPLFERLCDMDMPTTGHTAPYLSHRIRPQIG